MDMTPRLATVTLISLLASSVAIGCGPSARGIVESDMRFEHCYRIDEDTHVATNDKRACWTEWSAHYSRGQDGSRVRYADERRSVLEGAERPAPVGATATTATPTSAYVPPVSTEEPKAMRSGSELPLRDPAECRADCLHSLGACLALCVPGTDCAPLCNVSRTKCEHACE
ncbi:MAG: hypothetical protein ACHREM_33105 [Polyangiales bacterium]